MNPGHKEIRGNDGSAGFCGGNLDFDGSFLQPCPGAAARAPSAPSGRRSNRIHMTLKVWLTAPSPNRVHAWRNFGEAVYLALRDEHAVSIDEIDASTCEFHVRGIPKRACRATAARVRKMAQQSSLAALIDVAAIPEP